MKSALFAVTNKDMAVWTNDGKLFGTLKLGSAFVKLDRASPPGSMRTQILTSSGILEIYFSEGFVTNLCDPPK